MSVKLVLSKKDLENIEVALRLRIEACEENDDHRGGRVWRHTWLKITAAQALDEEVPTLKKNVDYIDLHGDEA